MQPESPESVDRSPEPSRMIDPDTEPARIPTGDVLALLPALPADEETNRR